MTPLRHTQDAPRRGHSKRKRALAALALIAYLSILAVIAAPLARAHWRPATVHNRVHAVTVAFCGSVKPCRLGNEALNVARCESGQNLWNYASNGIYLGMFQVSDHWRRTVPGWGWGPWHQARHAHRIYHLTGGWSHWSCSPR